MNQRLLHVQILGSVNCKKSITDLASACSDKSQSSIFKGIWTPALRQSGMKVKYVTTRPPSPPNLMFHFLESSWRSLLLEARFLAWNSEICRLMNSKEGRGVMGCEIIIGRSAKLDSVWQRGNGGQFCCKIAWRNGPHPISVGLYSISDVCHVRIIFLSCINSSRNRPIKTKKCKLHKIS